MALTSVKSVRDLEAVYVLAPERYDPRRESLASADIQSVPLRTLVTSNRKMVAAGDDSARRCLVFDTSDAREGIVIGRGKKQTVGELGSAKKSIEPRDVIISRLRPYLRQVALVDKEMPNAIGDTLVLCSTEFFVLRPADELSIAFLVPFLLSAPVQKVLAASQEGGHHPRFNESTLLDLPVPAKLVKDREAVSDAVQRGIALYRESEAGLQALIGRAESLLSVRNETTKHKGAGSRHSSETHEECAGAARYCGGTQAGQ